MSKQTYGHEGECGYNDCDLEAEWWRLTDDIGPGKVYVCDEHRQIEVVNARDMRSDEELDLRYIKVDRPPEQSAAVIAYLVKQVTHA